MQHLDQAVGHYIISDKPMTEEEWITARADRAKTISGPVTTGVTTDQDDQAKLLE